MLQPWFGRVVRCSAVGAAPAVLLLLDATAPHGPLAGAPLPLSVLALARTHAELRAALGAQLLERVDALRRRTQRHVDKTNRATSRADSQRGRQHSEVTGRGIDAKNERENNDEGGATLQRARVGPAT